MTTFYVRVTHNSLPPEIRESIYTALLTSRTPEAQIVALQRRADRMKINAIYALATRAEYEAHYARIREHAHVALLATPKG